MLNTGVNRHRVEMIGEFQRQLDLWEAQNEADAGPCRKTR
jgi:hypothetical protein